MKNLKKTAAVLTAAALTMSMGMSAFAETEVVNSIGGTSRSDVTGTYKSGTGVITYKVDVKWGDMQFTYNAASQGTWDPEYHTFSGATPGAWTNDNEGGNEITVTNHSNAQITAEVAFQAEPGFEGVSAEYNTNNFQLDDAAVASLGDPTKAPNETVTVSLKGDPVSLTSGQKIGSLTVTISE